MPTTLKSAKHWIDSLKIYLHPRAITLLMFGFSSGLPLLLVFGTLSFWLREAGVERSMITYFSWVGLAYGVKWAWAPCVDQLHLPWLTRVFGRRRSWLLFSQVALVVGLIGLGLSNPNEGLTVMALLAVAVALSSATQDIVIDAYRIESSNERLQAAMAATYMAGYRLAMIVAGAGALALAAWWSSTDGHYDLMAWRYAYFTMAGLMSLGVITTLIITEPTHQDLQETATQPTPIHHPIARFIQWLSVAVVNPFADFIARYGKQAIIILALIGTYRISDVILGIIANVFYVDMGFSKTEIAQIIKIYGIAMTIIGAGIGGILVNRFGTLRILFWGAILVAMTNGLFAWLAYLGPNTQALTLVISLDNLSGGVATAAFVAYLSSLTNIQYSATQYALFSSMMLLLPKFFGGFSGSVVDTWGYPYFFIGVAFMGLPVAALVWLASDIHKNHK